MTLTLGDAERCWKRASASDAALFAYLRRLADLTAGVLVLQDQGLADGGLQDSSWSAPRTGSLKPGPSARARNSVGLRLVQRRNAR